ncbi:phosphoribosyl-AMP cyclohydrolase [Methylophilaceae bacterium]|jgi:phosphoribosyl-AMP cyclohydrolase|nr:phosphoribosyl-AMP cyclohydrolase [Methylophilaceae bacterium]|tara:strand:- start:542 stop:940 length:399 start_codon:yes stop_codon:yes gene_type:complete
MSNWINDVRWGSDGLLPVIVQDINTSKIIMFAWMSRETLEESIKKKRAIYWSRSRKKVWLKGEKSGHYQNIKDMFLDCDKDSLLIKVEQEGGIACHTGRESCFYNRINMKTNKIEESEKIIKDPKEIYKDKE